MGRAIMLLMMMMTTTMLHAVLAQNAPASAPGPASPDCQTALLGLVDCLTYVTQGSNLTKPDKPCCPELAGLVKNTPICLCTLLANSSVSSSYGIDVNRALKLPTVCKVQTPPASECALAGIPVGAPSETPAKSPGSGITPQGPSASASKTANSVMAFLAGVVIAVLPIW
ncbi:non-specific lipid transfer protein GPI-anchored 2 [Prunus yedoensis var. nudiflora]|uniref:Non-specific lipid transfer protein GPI-anchored 2 n=1 Tax=Prunus yedoensis var. nudiflora TaxID=2094558 RepID=A0A314XUC6_PRUYE|nr:non-specific lipid transfer protein GPI-anchored 2 [Prunus yedoensis var. nudiflora]